MPTVGILAYGSLVEEPGPEIEAALQRVVSDVITPFKIEFAHKSKSRGDAPSLVPVTSGGAQVAAKILVLKDGMSADEGSDMVWRRETRQIGSGKRYNPPKDPGPNVVLVKRLDDFHNIDIVLYTDIGANIEPLSADNLAQLAIDSVRAADPGKDGISYLMAALARGMVTPLSQAYAQAIMRRVEVETLPDALSKLQARLRGQLPFSETLIMDQQSLLLEYLKEQYTQARQHETRATNATTFLTAAAGAMIGLAFKDGVLRQETLWIGLVIFLIGLANCRINIAHFNGNRFHTSIAGEARRTLEGTLGEWSTNTPTQIRKIGIKKVEKDLNVDLGKGESIGKYVHEALMWVPIGVMVLGLLMTAAATALAVGPHLHMLRKIF